MSNSITELHADRLMRERIERNRRIFMRVMFVALVGFIAGAVLGWPELLGVGL